MDKVNLAEKFALFDDAWHPRVVAELNGQQVKVVKLRGEFVWHHHEHEDELFWVVRGTLRLRFRDRDVRVGEGEFIVVPRGTDHLPVAETEEVWVVLIEPASTLNTGNVRGERTRETLERL
ncbi:cupin domain-containing protein [Deinococcus metallilatus]|uniref:Cupin domain-containing protein n=1 Tax=Deinococcus metallilatus TaxID=1211322 RepID=A0AAJ5F451_9DEIO|nr:cupin domain-containing protein [Deinococcus metallilatus]MBB5295995.1 mannose-6-phosphate isomerase-like protein (cupin superfamily) [Deinococcus metallilatus]QBY08184.1 cupin domain-containing protein [Deinococcus metallilatus]RXJ11916.1 cupin domain-containing protein [Deinococcus metallilatus]TLK25852.1 cupin domain-containing protein [Deinococcus metallilatus]GMA14470.1 mannose-6-phosphate isomerase [Deinococcus metallilatus]